MLEINFRCECINTCRFFDIEEGTKYNGLVVLDDTGETTLVVDIPGSEPIKCVSTWFVNYFKIIK